MKFKKTTAAASIAIACLLFFSAAVLGACSANPHSPETTPSSASEEKMDSPYAAYSKYGITYDEKTDSLFYNNERIRYFEDDSTFYNGDNTISGSLFFHTDKTGEGDVDIYTVRDSQNELTGTRTATEDEFMQKSGAYESTNQAISGYKKYGASTDAVGNIYFEDFLVRELYDPVMETIIQESRGAGFPKDSIDVEAVYDDGVLSGLRIVSKEEYDIHTQERIEAVQDFWVEQQKQRK